MLTSRVTEESIVKATDNQVSSNLVDEVIILKLDNGIYFGLNGTAVDIWEQIQDSPAIKDIQQTLIKKYDVTPETAMTELMVLLDQMSEAGLVNFTDAPAA